MKAKGLLPTAAVSFAVAVGLLSSAGEAQAQQQIPSSNGEGFDTHLFRPSMDSKGLFMTNGSDILGANDISFGLVIDYGNKLLRVDGVGQKSPQLVNHSFQGTAQFNYGLFNHVVVGLDIPVNLMAGDEQVATRNGVTGATEPGADGTQRAVRPGRGASPSKIPAPAGTGSVHRRGHGRSPARRAWARKCSGGAGPVSISDYGWFDDRLASRAWRAR